MPHIGSEVIQRLCPIFNRLFRPGRKFRLETLVFAEKLDSIDERITSTQHSLDKFVSAIEAYADHLASHTVAIKELGQSAAELRESSAEQNRVLARITEGLFTDKPRFERRYRAEPSTSDITPAAYEFIRKLEQRTTEAEDIKYSLQGLFVQDIRERTSIAREAATSLKSLAGISRVAGCNIKRIVKYRDLH